MPPFRAALLCAALSIAASSGAVAQARIGLAAPLSDNLAPLGQQMRQGAEVAASEGGAELVIADDLCTAEGGEAAARQFVEQQVAAVVGFLCIPAIEAALPVLTEAGIPVITPGIRANGLTDRHRRTGWLVFRVGPRADAEQQAVADILTRRWRDALFAIVDDGTIYGRELAESFRLAAETAGLRPVFTDTFRPQMDNQIGLVGRLRRAGATHVLVGGDREDVAIIARDAAGLDYDLTIAGGEALRAASQTPLAAGVLMIATPEWSEMLDEGAVERFEERSIVPEGYVVPSHASVEVALEALRRAEAGGISITEALRAGTFTTLIGELSFDEKGDLRTNPFELLRYDGERFLPVEE